MNTAMDALIEAIKADYANYKVHMTRDSDELSEFSKKMIAEFNESISYTVGKKYIKVVKNGSVWGFIVNADNDAKFCRGTVLKAAGWAAPARNFGRGNVITGNFNANWTGA